MNTEEMSELVINVQKNLIEDRGVADAYDLMTLHTWCILSTLDIIDKQVGRDASLKTMDMMIENFELSKAGLPPVEGVGV